MWNRGRHARALGRPRWRVAGRYTKLWLENRGSVGRRINSRFFGFSGTSTRFAHPWGAPVNASSFFVLPDWAPYAPATCKYPRAWQAATAASPRGKQKSGTVGCREYTSIFVSSETAPCSRPSACVLVRGAARMRHFHAKERAGNAGSWRASERLLPKNTDASSVI